MKCTSKPSTRSIRELNRSTEVRLAFADLRTLDSRDIVVETEFPRPARRCHQRGLLGLGLQLFAVPFKRLILVGPFFPVIRQGEFR